MNWLDKLERKFGHLAIKNLIHYIIGLNIFIYIIMLFDREGLVESRLYLIPSLVLKGEIWRVFTFVLVPERTEPLWIFFVLYFSYMVGSALEHEWGSFRFNMYYFLGMIFTIMATFITGGVGTAFYLSTSLFLAFARIYPNYQILIFFVLPVKVKYIAWFNWVVIAFTVISSPLSVKAAALASVINYFLFFGKDIITRTKTNRQVYYHRKSFHDNLPKNFTMHRCAVCGKTEKDDPKLEFRYCTSCEGDFEYCMEHLEAHEHKKLENQ